MLVTLIVLPTTLPDPPIRDVVTHRRIQHVDEFAAALRTYDVQVRIVEGRSTMRLIDVESVDEEGFRRFDDRAGVLVEAGD